MSIDRPFTEERLARIERMIEAHRVAKQRQLLQQALKTWRNAETVRRLVELDGQPERVH